MYSSSVTTGDFENFIARDVVAYIDAHYRTLARPREPRTGRPLDGRLWRDAHRHEARRRVRQPVHHESLLPLGAAAGARATLRLDKALEAARTPEDSGQTTVHGARATGAALRPGRRIRSNPPFYLDLPTRDGEPKPDVLAKWAANAPLAFIDQYVGNLRRYRGIALDVGDQDFLRTDTAKLRDVLEKYGIAARLRGIFGNAHQPRRRSFSEPRAAVLRASICASTRNANNQRSGDE